MKPVIETFWQAHYKNGDDSIFIETDAIFNHFKTLHEATFDGRNQTNQCQIFLNLSADLLRQQKFTQLGKLGKKSGKKSGKKKFRKKSGMGMKHGFIATPCSESSINFHKDVWPSRMHSAAKHFTGDGIPYPTRGVDGNGTNLLRTPEEVRVLLLSAGFSEGGAHAMLVDMKQRNDKESVRTFWESHYDIAHRGELTSSYNILSHYNDVCRRDPSKPLMDSTRFIKITSLILPKIKLVRRIRRSRRESNFTVKPCSRESIDFHKTIRPEELPKKYKLLNVSSSVKKSNDVKDKRDRKSVV